MSEYKNTLNLPRTEFPMKASLAQREPTRLENWEQSDVYQQIRKARAGQKQFILHDGPPYANGHLHCGHALNKILKDIIIKSKTMNGYDAPYQPGWDCHGLPIELNVEKKIGKAGVKVSEEAFRAKCRDYAKSQIDIQREEFKRLGILGDWKNPYVTMDYQYEANIVRALGDIIANGHLSQGFKPVHWCLDCGSALAEAEVDYEDKISPSIDVAFFAVDAQDIIEKIDRALPPKEIIVPIWTTTPWTLPANEAVSVHPELQYSLIDDGKRYYLVASDLIESVMGRYGIEKFTAHKQFDGSLLEGFSLKHPLYQKEVPLVLSTHVTTDSGTGCVHTAPAHGPDDYIVGKKYDLPIENPVLGHGCYADSVEFFAGMHVTKANPEITNMLRDKGLMLHEEMVHHSYPHCWRHKTPVIFRATPQWFISMDNNGLRQNMLSNLDGVNWVPDWGQARIHSMIENRPDWCVSRQRAWGTPIPLFVHKQTREIHLNTNELIEQVASRVEKQGIDGWFNLSVEELLGHDSDDYEKITDTLDVWFDSGVTHYCVLKHGHQLGYPADLYLEGSDQHRGWFNSSLTTSVAINGEPPYKTVLTHGFTVDAEGKKLSKSRGNYVALDKLIKQHGADILRLWVSSTDYKYEVSISDEILKRNGDAYRRIRNTMRFLLSNLFDFDPEKHILSSEQMIELDKWAIQRTKDIQKDIVDAYENYQFHVIYQKIHNFCAVDMGSFYLDIIKDRQYTTPENSRARRSCQTAMYHILHAFVRWLAPILSFTAEEAWQYVPGSSNESIFLQTWYDQWPDISNVSMAKWVQIKEIRDAVNRSLELKRKEGVIGSGLAAEVTIFADGDIKKQLDAFENELRFVLITSQATVKPKSDNTNHQAETNDLGIDILIQASEHEKCARCWHRREDVGSDTEYADLCIRCVGNISGKDEARTYA